MSPVRAKSISAIFGVLAISIVLFLILFVGDEIRIQYCLHGLQKNPHFAAAKLGDFATGRLEFPASEAMVRFLKKPAGRRLLLKTSIWGLLRPDSEQTHNFNWNENLFSCDACVIWTQEERFGILKAGGQGGAGGKFTIQDPVLKALLGLVGKLSLLEEEETSFPEFPDIAFRFLPEHAGFMVSGISKDFSDAPRPTPGKEIVCVGRRISKGLSGKQVHGPAAISILLEGARSQDPGIRKLALETCQHTGVDPADPVPYLIGLIRSNRWGFEDCMDALRDQGARAVIPLIEALGDCCDPSSQFIAVILGDIASTNEMLPPETREKVIRVLRNIAPEIVNHLIEKLDGMMKYNNLGKVEVVGFLLKFVRTLELIGPGAKDAIGSLTRLLEDQNAALDARWSARAAILKIDPGMVDKLNY